MNLLISMKSNPSMMICNTPPRMQTISFSETSILRKENFPTEKTIRGIQSIFLGKFEGRLGLQEGEKATISNIHVHQTGELDPSTTRGIGFFGSISSQRDDNDIGISKGTTVVEGIHLENVTVQNESMTVKKVDHSLVKILLGTVGGVLGGVLGLVECFWVL